MNGFLEVIKTNKKAIVKKSLIVGGTLAGLALVMQAVKTTKDESDDDFEVLEINEEVEVTEE